MVVLSFQSDVHEQSYGCLNALDTQGNFDRTTGLRRHRTIASKYAFNNLELRTGSPTRSVVTRVRSSASNQYSRLVAIEL